MHPSHSRARCPLVVCILTGLGTVLAGSLALADGSPNAFHGAFSTEVPIAIPEFRGMEPQVKLSYNSSGQNGILGVGWTLGGVSAISRAGPGGGAPSFSASDLFFLDGKKLVPNCTELGGEYCTEIQSYLRIIYDDASNQFHVYSKNGTKAVFEPLEFVGPLTTPTFTNTYRFVLFSIVDTNGNQVDYDYFCDAAQGGTCYLTTISYGSADVFFHYEDRPDDQHYGDGRAVRQLNWRIKTIDVMFDNQRVRAYKLVYSLSALTGRSLLSQVIQYGSNAVLTNGTVTGGSALPANVMSYTRTDALTFQPRESETWFGASAYDMNALENEFWPTGSNGLAADALNLHVAGDFNGDGRTDIAMSRGGWAGWNMYFANSTDRRSFNLAHWGTGAHLVADQYNFVVGGDFNGDGRSDIAFTRPGWSSFWVYLSKVDGGFNAAQWTISGNGMASDALNYIRVGDFNNDGLDDIAWTRPGWLGVRVAVAQFGGGFSDQLWNTGNLGMGSDAYNHFLTGDFNGDGRTDLALTRPAWNGVVVMLSNNSGNGFDVNGWSTDADGMVSDQHNYVRTGDFNGDGLTDIAITRPGWNSFKMRLNNRSSGFICDIWATGADGMAADGFNQMVTGDFNGDGASDIAFTRPGWGAWRMRLTQVAGGFISWDLTTDGENIGGDSLDIIVTGDFNGDFKHDIAYTRPAWDGFKIRLASVRNGGVAAYPWMQAELNGDGRMDMVRPVYASPGWCIQTATSTGDGTYALDQQTPNGWWHMAGRWFATDLNGDGLSDLALPHWRQDGNFHVLVLLRTAAGTWTSHEWINGWGVTPGEWQVGDMDGDGRSDFFLPHYRPADSHAGYEHVHVLIARSNGDGGFTPYEWANGWGAVGGKWLLGDINGDSKTDILRPHWRPADSHAGYSHFHMLVALNNGGGSFSPHEYANGWGVTPLNWSTGDINGDGLGDLASAVFRGPDAQVNYRHLHFFTLLGSGGGDLFSGREIETTWGYMPGVASKPWGIADMNGDGLGDLVQTYWHPGYQFNALIAESRADGTIVPRSYANGWGFYKGYWLMGDFDGNGLQDLAMPHFRLPDGSAGYTHAHILQASNMYGTPDLMQSMTNGAGGSSTVSYLPSSGWSNTFLPVGFNTQTAYQVTTADGRGTSSTMTYNYEGGLWSSPEKRFLGFRKVTAIIDPAGNYTETYYNQTIGNISKPDATYLRDPAGNIWNYSAMVYTENASPPYTSLMTERWDYECDATTTCRRSLTQFSYDTYGNVYQTLEYGDYDVSGDERTRYLGYHPNTTKYIVGLVSDHNLFEGLGWNPAKYLARTEHLYDGNATYDTPPSVGNLTKIRNWDDVNNSYADTVRTHDAHGQVISETDPLGNMTTKTFDSTYELFAVEACNELSQCVQTSWDPVLSVKTSSTDINGNTTSTQYDVFGRVTKTTNPSGAYTTFSYNNWGQAASQYLLEALCDSQNQQQSWTKSFQDGLGRVYLQENSAGHKTETLYSDTSGRVWKQSRPYDPAAGEVPQWEIRAYDGAGRLRTTTHPDGSTSEVIYRPDSYGPGWRRICDELDHCRSEHYDAHGWLTKVREHTASGYNETTYAYNLRGQLASVTDPLGNVSTFSHNSLNRKLTSTFPDVGTTTYSYDARGRLISQADALYTTTFTYDALNRVLTKSVGGQVKVRYTYDNASIANGLGRVSTITFDAGSQTFNGYHWSGAATSVTEVILGVSKTTSASFDGFGRMISKTYPDNETVSYSYDGLGRPAWIGGYIDSVTYDARNRIKTLEYANGVSATYDYDAEREWLNQARFSLGSTVLWNGSYSYDLAARVISSSATDVANPGSQTLDVNYTYDTLNRLTQVSGERNQSFVYDALGRITNNSAVGAYTYHATKKHAAVSAGSNTYTYNAVGNMLTGAGRTFAWDWDGRLTSIVDGSGTTTFAYGSGEGRLAKTDPSGYTTRYFEGYEDSEAEGALVKRITLGSTTVARKVGSTVTFIHQDRLGSTRLMTNASGNPVGRYGFDAFGATDGQTGAAAASNDIQWQNQRKDGTGLYYMTARYYDPVLARFISADTLVPDAKNPQAYDLYQFGYNNPVNNTDPSGHAPIVAAVAAVASVVGSSAAAWVVGVTVVGAVCSTVGYITKNPMLATIGSVALGFAGGWTGGAGFIAGPGWGGAIASASMALSTSPISPLSPGVKMAVGWAFSVQGMIKGQPKNEMGEDPILFLNENGARAVPGSVGGPAGHIAGGGYAPISTLERIYIRLGRQPGDVKGEWWFFSENGGSYANVTFETFGSKTALVSYAAAQGYTQMIQSIVRSPNYSDFADAVVNSVYDGYFPFGNNCLNDILDIVDAYTGGNIQPLLIPPAEVWYPKRMFDAIEASPYWSPIQTPSEWFADGDPWFAENGWDLEY